MLENLKKQREELQKRGKKGFTLMEMLIVIAIIAILIAIAIPIFTSQLNAARVATDEANARSGYAVATATVLTDNIKTDTTWSLNSDGTLADGNAGTYTTGGKQDTATVIGATSGLTWEPGKHVVYTYSASAGMVTISFA